MLKLLIIDDEEIICQTIAKLIDWSSLGICLIGTCLDGVEAYHTILDESPDIVMTDIRMPGISGLELIERIHQTDLNTQFIILSGYGEFEYAKRAMKSGIRHYLLKPCDESQIIHCIQEVIADCQKESLTKESQKKQSDDFRNLHHTLLQNMIREGISLPELSPSFWETYEHYINLTDTPYQYCCFYFLEEKNVSRCLLDIAAFFSVHAPQLQVQELYLSNILLLFFPDYAENYDPLDRYFASLTFPEQTVTITYERQPYPNLRSLITTLVPKLKRYDTFYFIENGQKKPNHNYSQIVVQMNQLILQFADIPCNCKAALFEELTHILQSVSNPDFLIQLADNLLISLTTQSAGYPLAEITHFLYTLHQGMDSADPAHSKDIAELTLKKAEEILALNSAEAAPLSPFIQKLIQYLEENIADPTITLKGIAEHHLYMNVNYVSRCFVKETHQKFSGYLMNLRVEKAKELLSTHDNEKIQNIAELVVCGNNPYYFSKIFKKCTGMTPSAYVRRTID